MAKVLHVHACESWLARILVLSHYDADLQTSIKDLYLFLV